MQSTLITNESNIYQNQSTINEHLPSPGALALPNEFILCEYCVKTANKYTETVGKRFTVGRSRPETHEINQINSKSIQLNQILSKPINIK